MSWGVIGRGVGVLRGQLSYRVVAPGVVVPRVVVLGVVAPGVVVPRAVVLGVVVPGVVGPEPAQGYFSLYAPVNGWLLSVSLFLINPLVFK